MWCGLGFSLLICSEVQSSALSTRVMAAVMSEVTPNVCVTEAQMAFKSFQSSPFMLTLSLFTYIIFINVVLGVHRDIYKSSYSISNTS
jgi:hypothetical protein